MAGARGRRVTVEPVGGRVERRRFAEVPYALHRAEPQWAPTVRAFDQWRLDRHRHPYLASAGWELFLARLQGRPVGRIAVHLPSAGASVGHFGFFDAADDDEVLTALVDAAVEWVGDQGATTLTGPLSWTADDEVGVLVEGFDVPGATGRPWHPPWLAAALVEARFTEVQRFPSYRLAVAGGEPAGEDRRAAAAGRPVPPHAGPYGDPRLVGPAIAAVPDVSDEQRQVSLRSALSTARRARARHWTTAVVVRLDPDRGADRGTEAERGTGAGVGAADAVAWLLAAAGDAGYSDVLSPWAPDDRTPETIRATFTIAL